MADRDRLHRLVAITLPTDPLGQQLIEVYRLALDGCAVDAAAKIEFIIANSSEAQIVEKALPLIEASFVANRLDLVASALEKISRPSCQITVESSVEISLDYIVLIEKIAHGALHFTLSEKISKYNNLEAYVSWLIWILPLFTKVASSKKVSPGRAFLNQWDAGVVPGFSYCAAGRGFFLIPDVNFVSTHGYSDFKARLQQKVTPWSQRTPIAFWRGSTTGQSKGGWRNLQRVALSQLSIAHPTIIDAGLSSVVQQTDESTAEIRASGLMREFFPARDLHRFRYLIDIDGNTSAWSGLFERLLSGSTVLKVESRRDFQQWYYPRLRPWQHYVPVRADMSDLVSKIEWLIGHDKEAEKIGQNARDLAYSIEYETELETAVETVGAAFRSFSAMSVPVGIKTLGRKGVSTHHGTFLTFDLETSRIVHVARDLGFLPGRFLRLSLAPVGTGALLVSSSGKFVGKIRDNGNAEIVEDQAQAGDVFEIIKRAENSNMFALKLRGLFLCAEEDGGITVSRNIAGNWETFHNTPQIL